MIEERVCEGGKHMLCSCLRRRLIAAEELVRVVEREGGKHSMEVRDAVGESWMAQVESGVHL